MTAPSDHERLREAIRKVRTEEAAPFDKVSIVPSIELSAVLAAAESTLPKTKMVEVWHCVWMERSHAEAPWWPCARAFWNQRDAESYWSNIAKDEARVACIRVTGPHQQEVPA